MKLVFYRSIRPLIFLAIIILTCLFSQAVEADKPIIYHVDLRYTEGLAASRCWDMRLASVCLQGLVNRDAPRLFLSFTNTDRNWLDRITEPGALCDGWQVREITWAQMFSMFRGYINGLIMFDPDPSTGAISSSLAAATAAGVEGGIALRKDTTSYVYRYLVYTMGIPVSMDLAGKFTGSGTIYDSTTASTGSAKCDAYIWAKEHYLDTGECDPTVLSYTLDMYGLSMGTGNACQLQNIDYAIMKKGFCFELSPWGDEEPSDDLNQPLGTDLSTFKSILNACNTQTNKSKMIKVCGFVNWPYKYTNYGSVGGSHSPTDGEWEFVRILSAYNCYLEADAPSPSYVANASFYAGLMPEFYTRHYVQNPAPTYNDLVSRGLINSNGTVPNGNYVLYAMCDYDQVSWLMNILANEGGVYDGDKSSVYCNWGVDPNGIDRACVAFDYMYRNKTNHDFFMGWDSGAGYVNPTQLYGSRNPSGYASATDIWEKHCEKYYRPLDYSITAWLLNGNVNVDSTCCGYYTQFSGDGMAVQYPCLSTPTLVDNVPVSRVYSYVPNSSGGVYFGVYRGDAQKTVAQMKSVEDSYASSGKNHKFLDAYSFYYLLRYYRGGSNNYRETWVDDNVPRLMQAGGTYSFSVTVRNDGWDTWSGSSNYHLGCALVSAGTTPANSNYDSMGRFDIPNSGSVVPGGSVTFTVTVTAPSTPGEYDLYFDMVRDGTTWFRYQNNLESLKTISVVSDPSVVDTDGDGTPDEVEATTGTYFWYPGDNYELGPATPSAPTDIGAYTTSTTVKFTWTAVANAGAGYYCQVGTTPGGNDVYDGYLGNVLYKSIVGTDGSTYYCRVQAMNDSGYVSAWSASSDGIAIDKTAPSTPAAPTGNGIYSSSSVTFNWNAANDATSCVAGYYCHIGTTSGGTDIYNGYVGNVLSKTVSGAVGSTLYCSVCAQDNAGNTGSYSPSSDGVLVVSYSSDNVASLKNLADGTTVGVSDKIVTGVYSGFFYIEDTNRVSGIKVISSANVVVNQLVDVAGTMATENSERCIDATNVATGAMSSINPLGISGKSMTCGGLSPVGLLIRTWGTVTHYDSASGYCYIDDGSGASDGSGYVGVKVITGTLSGTIDENIFYKLTGVLGMSAGGCVIYPQTSTSMVQ